MDASSERCLRPRGRPRKRLEGPLEEQVELTEERTTLQTPQDRTKLWQTRQAEKSVVSEHKNDIWSLANPFLMGACMEMFALQLPSVPWTLAACLLCWWTVWTCTRCPLPAQNERFPTPDLWIPGRSSEWSNVPDPASQEQTGSLSYVTAVMKFTARADKSRRNPAKQDI